MTKRKQATKRAIRKSARKYVSDEEGTAYHEAGHVFAAIHFRRPFASASIVETEDSLGHVLVRFWKDFRPDEQIDLKTKDRIESTVIGLLAGGAAEKIRCGVYNSKGSQDDWHKAVDIVTYLYCDPRVIDLYLQFIYARTENLIGQRNNWRIVREIAEGLVAHKKLGRRRLIELYKVGNRKAMEEFHARNQSYTR